MFLNNSLKFIVKHAPPKEQVAGHLLGVSSSVPGVLLFSHWSTLTHFETREIKAGACRLVQSGVRYGLFAAQG